MTQTWEERAREVVEELASRYRAAGYEVALDDNLAEAPDVRADLVARRGADTVLVEVKRVRREGPPNRRPPTLKRLAEIAAARRWKFTVVLVGEHSFDEVEVLPRADVLRIVEDASRIEPSSQIATIASISAFEAAARFALTRIGVVPRPGTMGPLQALASRGLLSPDDEQAVEELLRARDAAAHGKPVSPVPSELVTRVLGVTANLLNEHPAAA